MANSTLSALTALTGASTAIGDQLYISDVSESGLNKSKSIRLDELATGVVTVAPAFVQSGIAPVATTVEEKIRQYPDTPEDRGAVGDSGSTNDTSSLQAWIDAVPASAGGTDPGYALQLTDGKDYHISVSKLTVGNRRISFKGNASGMGSGSGSITQATANVDIIDFTTGNSDAVSFDGFMLIGPASGTGRGIVGGRAAQAWFDSRVTNMWFASIGGKCIEGVNMQGVHITNSGFDSGATDAVVLTKGSDNVLALNRLYGLSSSGYTILEGDNNLLAISHIDLSGAENDTTAAILIDVDAAGGKIARGNLLVLHTLRANKNDLVLDGNSGSWFGNTGVDSTLILGNLSDRAEKRFLLATDAHKIAVIGNLISDPNQDVSTFPALEFAGDCDGVYLTANKVSHNRGSGPLYEYAVTIGASIGPLEPLVLGENDFTTGSKGRYNVASGAHVKALPGCDDYERFMLKFFDDFMGPALESSKWDSDVGSDPQVVAPVILADQVGGAVRMTTGDDAAANMTVNGVQMFSARNWKSLNGSLIFEAKVKLSAITAVQLFIGFTDSISGLLMPFTYSGTTLTSNITDGCGFLFDTDATTDNWKLVGVANNVDATVQDAGVAPSVDTYQTFRMEFVSNGAAVKFYINHTLVGAQMNSPMLQGAVVSPIIAAFSGAASRSVTVDYVKIESERGT